MAGGLPCCASGGPVASKIVPDLTYATPEPNNIKSTERFRVQVQIRVGVQPQLG